MNIKEKIMQRVNSIDNPKVLDEILKLISTQAETEEIYKFNPAERKNVMEGMADAEEGRTHSQKEADNLISIWLKERSGGQ